MSNLRKSLFVSHSLHRTPSVEDGSGGVSEGSPVSLPCSAEGTPAPRVEWFFNGLPVRRGGHKVRKEQEEGGEGNEADWPATLSSNLS